MISSAPLLGKHNKLLLFFSAICFSAIHSTAQLNPEQSYEQKIDAVYSADFFTEKPELRAAYVKLLSERISYVQTQDLPSDKYELLSSVPLHPFVTPEQAAFDPSTFSIGQFNPLFYSLSFFEWNQAKVYRIDGTDYYLIIQPQTSGK